MSDVETAYALLVVQITLMAVMAGIAYLEEALKAVPKSEEQ
jgi:hypothetical protein